MPSGVINQSVEVGTARVKASTTTLSELLDAVEAFLGRFVAYPSKEAKVAHVLWITHTHCMDEWDSTPRICFLSPEPSSGKTRALEVSETMVPRPIEAISATPSYLFRKVSDDEGRPTILYDEIDTVFGPKAKENEEIRGMLNAGHRKGAVAGRCVRGTGPVTTEELPAYCAVAMAGLGKLPDTILNRSVVIQMRRRAPTERIEPYRRRIHAQEGYALRDQLAVWAEQFRLDGFPKMPCGVEDRAADVWEGLIAIADAAGDRWSKRARDTAVTLVTDAKETPPSLGVRLLADLREIFDGSAQLPTKTILEKLCAMEEAPWGDLRGKPLDPRRLSNYLRSYEVKPDTLRGDYSQFKGYKAADLSDAWNRYLPALSDKSVPSVPSVPTYTDGENGTAGTAGTGNGEEAIAGQVRCADCAHFERDQVGDGTGIGSCGRGCAGQYPKAEHYCEGWEASQASSDGVKDLTRRLCS